MWKQREQLGDPTGHGRNYFFFASSSTNMYGPQTVSRNALGARAVPTMEAPMTPVWLFVSCLLMELWEISSRNNHIANTTNITLPAP